MSGQVKSVMGFDEYVETMEQIGLHRRTTDKREVLVNVFDRVNAIDAELLVRVILGEHFDEPGRNTNIEEKSVIRAAATAYGVSESKVKEYHKEHGKVSDAVAEVYGSSQQMQLGSTNVNEMTHLRDIEDLYNNLADDDSDTARLNTVAAALRGVENEDGARWLSYALLNDLSLYCGDAVVKKSLVDYYGIDRECLDRAHSILGTVASVVRVLVGSGDLPTEPSVGSPFTPMLADGVEEFPSGDEWVAQPKYDGARLVIHYDGTDLKFFTRNRNDVTDSLPEIKESLDLGGVGPFIIDGEAVARDPEGGEMLAYEKCMHRFRREKNIEEARQDVEIQFYAFDVIYSETGTTDPFVADKPLYQRVDILELLVESLVDGEEVDLYGEQYYTDGYVGTSPLFTDDLEAAYQTAIDDGLEGVILKDLTAPYAFTPPQGNRPDTWLKVKPSETVDLRVTAVEVGEGENAGRLGRLHVETEDGTPVGAVGNGFSDELRAQYPVTGYHNDHELVGSIIEAKAEGLTTNDDGGYGLRFPSFERFRDESDATVDGLERVKEILR